jgi:two-component system response regulator (stage 0 sporulation protein F)
MATILIIDDEELVRTLLRSALEEAGYKVTEAANGRQGLELYRQRPADLVITDIVMPELNGLDMLIELTREFLHARVIAISGAGGGKNALDVAKLLGARQTFQKPFSMPHLLGAVRFELDH